MDPLWEYASVERPLRFFEREADVHAASCLSGCTIKYAFYTGSSLIYLERKNFIVISPNLERRILKHKKQSEYLFLQKDSLQIR
ncbi:hypothetical protein BA1379B_009810 [Bartonella sp. A1379B]|uniref:Uncharacterized protein n=1 Tax=Bartonella rochalimae ATCC BAA-1498 TaxID=685782 RepID=A0A067W3X1_9HYPH|nr:hypothetical protein BA1379B_009810 [Bartonella sp. A1379B]KEC54414.1 hypothetical protein O99_00951 [Bartonella rochalimae ATCC BAA-1498]